MGEGERCVPYIGRWGFWLVKNVEEPIRVDDRGLHIETCYIEGEDEEESEEE